MSATASALVRSWQVGRFTATLTAQRPERGQVTNVVIEWAPHVPQRLTPDEIEQYRTGRNEAIASLGLRALVLEV